MPLEKEASGCAVMAAMRTPGLLEAWHSVQSARPLGVRMATGAAS